jgi:hypothetical protein
MGVLTVMRHRTALFGGLADHTYVRCGSGGAAWGCWGGAAGGTRLREADGSTARADRIAGHDGRAGIACYLVIGVCHQAANRILLPAGITVRGALGYDVSEALFGAYGRPRGPLGLCAAPFDQHPGIVGDLPACVPVTPKRRRQPRARIGARARREQAQERRYLDGVLAIYGKARAARPRRRAAAPVDVEGLQTALFMHKVDYQLASRPGRRLARTLEDLRRSTERARMTLEEWLLRREMPLEDFVEAFNRETVLFQELAAGVMPAPAYRRLFGAPPGRVFVLADPRIARRALATTLRAAPRPE